MTNPFDVESVTEKSGEESLASPDNSQETKGEESLESGPEGQDRENSEPGEGVPDKNKISELERKLESLNTKVFDLVAENASLKSSQKSKEEEGEERFTKEQLKEFAMENEGSQQFDAAIAYVDQVRSDVKKEVSSELEGAQKREKMEGYMLNIYPDLADENSEFSRSVRNEQLRIVRRGEAPDENAAYSMALHRVGKTRPSSGESMSEFSGRRRVEESGGEGAPRGTESPPSKKNSLSAESVRIGKKMGLDMGDPKVRQRILQRQNDYSNKRLN